MLSKLSRTLSLSLGTVSALCVAALMLTVIADTTGRFLFGSSIPGANDFNRYWWMVLIVFGALGAAEHRNEHIEALVLENIMPPRLRVIWRYIRATVVCIILALIIIAAFPAAVRHQQQGEYAAGSEISIWPTRYILVLGVTIFLITVVLKAFEDRTKILNGTHSGEDIVP